MALVEICFDKMPLETSHTQSGYFYFPFSHLSSVNATPRLVALLVRNQQCNWQHLAYYYLQLLIKLSLIDISGQADHYEQLQNLLYRIQKHLNTELINYNKASSQGLDLQPTHRLNPNRLAVYERSKKWDLLMWAIKINRYYLENSHQALL